MSDQEVKAQEEKAEVKAEVKTEAAATEETVAKETAKKEDEVCKDDFKNLHVLVVTSGKGGVGKTTSSAAIATGLAKKGHKTAVIDFDVGLRNLDLIMGCERRVVYDFVNVIQGDAKLSMALIKDRHVDNLFVLPASQTKDKDASAQNYEFDRSGTEPAEPEEPQDNETSDYNPDEDRMFDDVNSDFPDTF